MTPLERARAALQSAWDSGGNDVGNLPDIIFTHKEADFIARAVIQAIREPSSPQIWAGARAAHDAGKGDGGYTAAEACHQAMIDALLAEGGK